MSRKNIFLLFIILVTIVACAAPEFVARGLVSPDVKHCNDSIGHIVGNKPFILGGNCVCTPTEKRFATHVKENTIGNSVTYQEYLRLFQNQRIVTDLDHKGCNNLCEHGPHVVFGGRCMATPTPGTLNYERVISGNRNLTLIFIQNNDYEIRL
jgi:hypothetical protein